VFPIIQIILNYAQGVYPEIFQAQVSSYMYSILKRFRKIAQQDSVVTFYQGSLRRFHKVLLLSKLFTEFALNFVLLLPDDIILLLKKKLCKVLLKVHE
jgi:hypothetical protein